MSFGSLMPEMIYASCRPRSICWGMARVGPCRASVPLSKRSDHATLLYPVSLSRGDMSGLEVSLKQAEAGWIGCKLSGLSRAVSSRHRCAEPPVTPSEPWE